MIDKISDGVTKFAELLEKILGIIVIIFVVIGIFKLFRYFDFQLYTYSAELVHDFLYDVLMLVIGVEFTLMLLTHDINKVLKVLIFAVARKTLVASYNMFDVLLGVLAATALYAANKFLVKQEAANEKVEESVEESLKVDSATKEM